MYLLGGGGDLFVPRDLRSGEALEIMLIGVIHLSYRRLFLILHVLAELGVLVEGVFFMRVRNIHSNDLARTVILQRVCACESCRRAKVD